MGMFGEAILVGLLILIGAGVIGVLVGTVQIIASDIHRARKRRQWSVSRR